jgi:hypothetical protein
MPVTLGPREQARIGVTFAPVLRAPLDRSVRTVAQVSYDETRVKAVALIEQGGRLFVTSPARPCVRAIRSSASTPMVVTAQQELPPPTGW